MTPSYNQGRYVEQTIRSVLLQGYPNLEYMVIDGGSTDSSFEIIRRYAPWLTYWVSEDDRGQSAAINKGFARGTGDIYGYLNSDDVYQPQVLARVARDFRNGPVGLHSYPVQDVHDEGGRDSSSPPRKSNSESQEPYRRPVLRAFHPDRLSASPRGMEWSDSLVPLVVGELYFHQPGVFWPRSAHRRVGGFDEGYSFLFDQKFFLELLLTGVPLICHGGDPVAVFRHHDHSKTVVSKRERTNPFSLELWRIAREIEPQLRPSEREVVRRKRISTALSRVWRELRSGSGRVGAARALARGLADHPDLVTDRFFWATLLAVGGVRRAGR